MVISFGFLVQQPGRPTDHEAFGGGGGFAIVPLEASFPAVLPAARQVPWRHQPRHYCTRADEPMVISTSRAELARRQAAHDADPDQAVSCPHLQPIERAMRHADLRLPLGMDEQSGGSGISAACHIDLVELTRVITPLTPLR